MFDKISNSSSGSYGKRVGGTLTRELRNALCSLTISGFTWGPELSIFYEVR